MRPVDGPELKAAVEWWAGQLDPMRFQKLGDRQREIEAASFMFDRIRQATPEAVEIFKRELRKGILEDANWVATWASAENSGEPHRGAVFRVLATDYGPEKLLDAALQAAGIHRLNVPMKTVMWVNPGIVTVGVGHAAPVETIYGEMNRDDA